MKWKLFAKSIIYGAIFAFFVYILSDSSASLGMGLLLSYMNYKIESLKEEAFDVLFTDIEKEKPKK